MPRPRLLVVPLALVVTSALGGCGSGGESSSEPAAQTGETTRTAATYGAAPVKSTPLADVQEAKISIPGDPDWLAELDGTVFVKGDDGWVVKVDPQSDRASGRVRADTKSEQFCQGIGAGGGSVWSCSGSDVVRIDPERLEVVASIPVMKVFDQGRLVFADGRVWVLTGEGDQLVGIDAASGEPGEPIALPERCDELGPGADVVWVICRRPDAVLRFDPASRKVTGRLDIESPSYATGSASALWVGHKNGLARVEPSSLEVVGAFDGLDPGVEGDLALAGDDLWVRTAGEFLSRIDTASNTVAEQISLDEPLSGGSLLFASGSLWTTASDDGLLFRVRTAA